MNKILLIMVEVCLGYAAGASASQCTEKLENKHACVAGEVMRCVKSFDPDTKNFRYEWEAVNLEGQSFDVNSILFKKTIGYTPMRCSRSENIRNIQQNGL